MKLLVVDDEEDICDFVRSFFKERNFDVKIAHNGKTAVEAVRAESPEIVLLDLKMPVMGGIEALKEIKTMGKKCRVIVVTALEDMDTVDEARKCGAVDYITKPLLLEQLERTVLTLAEQIKTETV
ncbi:MAG TPA: response regulator [Candidatus Omnitrophota bacterium]|nr:response regulator [Candidatus Omnitrophota bacterium]